MSEEVVTSLVIDADVSGANTFIQAMEGAEKAAQGTTSSATGMWAALGGATVVGAVAGVSSFLDQVAKLNKDLAEVNQNAKTFGFTLAGYQSYRFAANVSGLDDKDLNNGLQKTSALLNDAQRNANSLTKIFDANGLSIKNANGQLITENQLLDTAANLVKKAATEQDKIKIAEMLGFTKQWVPFLEQGADAISRTASEAEKAGAVIDSATIQKADDFDKAWKRSSTEWSVNLRAAAATVLPYIDDVIMQAGKIFTKENLKGVAKPGQDVLDKVIDPELKIGIDTTSLDSAIKEWIEGGQDFLGSVRILFTEVPKVLSIFRDDPALKPREEEGPWQEQGPWTPAGWKKALEPNSTKIPGNDVGRDQLDRAIEQLEKHTARTKADTDATGSGVSALLVLREDAKAEVRQTTIAIVWRINERH